MTSLLARTDSIYPAHERGTKTLTNISDDRPERAFDLAIQQGDMQTAQALISEMADDANRQLARGYYPKNIWPILYKELAMPLYNRDFQDGLGAPQPDYDDAVTAVHGDVMNILEYFVNQYDLEMHLTQNPNSPYMTRLRGDTTEAAIIGMLTANILGMHDDPFNVTPATARQEHSMAPVIPLRGFNRNIDSIIRRRDTKERLLTQIQTTPPHQHDTPYNSRIAVVSLASIAMPGPRNVHNLQHALIRKERGASTRRDERRVEVASRNLNDIIYARLGRPALRDIRIPS